MIALLLGGVRDLIRDLLAALEALLDPGPKLSRLLPAALGLAAAWILYVPIHELLHAAGCLASGGGVSEVRLAPLYGGSVLGRLFPFVVPSTAGGYAGRVTGFDTKGSDLRYLATDAAPYLLTVLIGMPLLRRMKTARTPGAAWLFGPAVILASAPLIGLTGDYFEMGTVLATRMIWWEDVTRLRSDDLFRLIGEIRSGQIALSASGALALSVSLPLALVLASWTCRLGTAVAVNARRARPRAS